jgi:hypothetical protein
VLLAAAAPPLYAQTVDDDQDTLLLLKDFAAKAPSMKDNDALAALKELSKKIPDERLPVVEKFSLNDDAKDLRFGFAFLLVERASYDPAARLIAKSLSEEEKDREYKMWKWWEFSFGKRKDYKELTHRITAALLRQFDKGDEKTKIVVAEIFGKGKTEAKMSLGEFKKSINYKDDN